MSRVSSVKAMSASPLAVNSLDHVALWVADRDAIADLACEHLGMHVIERTDKFTLVGADARRFKLTLFSAEGPREPGALVAVILRVNDLDHVVLRVEDAEASAQAFGELGFERDGHRLFVAGSWVTLEGGGAPEGERPLLNHLAVLVDSAEAVERQVRSSGAEIADVVDAKNTLAVFVWTPGRVKLEYVEHKASFSLT